MSNHRVTALLFWDIDGTLLTTARAGMRAWADAASELAGRRVDLLQLKTAGFTDYQIAVEILASLAIEPNGDRLQQLVRRYEELLPASLPLKDGRVLAGVRELLEFLRTNRPDIVSYLLTGNTRVGAGAKLRYYGLEEHFPDGAFAEDSSARAAIARRALELADRRHGVASDRLFVIGDTPHDVRCGQVVGARTVAVASGEYSVDELRACEPWRALERLPAPEAFVALVDGAVSFG